jgi:hypothetical protein
VPAEPYVQADGQRIFLLFPPPCGGCPRCASGRCSGPQTVDSQIRNQGKLLGCFDTAEAAALEENLDRYRPANQPSFCTIQGLPTSIPVLCEGMPRELRLNAHDLYGIALDDLVRDNGSLRYGTASELREAFRLPRDGRLCLIGSARDTRLEDLWARSARDLVWRRIRRLGFEFATGVTFSVFEQQSRRGQLVNQDRNMASVELLASEGLPVVPVFCEVIEEDLDFAARWLEERPSLEVVAGLAQGWKTDAEFPRFLWRMKFLKDHVRRPLHFLIIGCSSADRIWTLFQELGAVTVANTNLAISGVNGAGWDSQYHKMVTVPQEIPREEVIPESFQSFAEFCEFCAGETRTAA